jgi:16S rRNA (cytosine1402-N4)-methyltransferase
LPPEPDAGRRQPTFRLLYRSALTPDAIECAVNPRARSARLRAAVRTDAPARQDEVAA